MNFDVFAIMTRFAIPISFKPGGERSDLEDPIHHLDDRWLEERLYLLEKWCAPTVRSQTDKDFIWVFGVDERVPDRIKKHVLEVGGRNAVISEVRVGEKFPAAYTRAVAEYGNRIISSRLDSDDGISKHFVRTVKNNIEENKALNFVRGLRYDPRFEQGQHRFDKNNPYMSYMSTDGLHVYDLGSHGHWGERGVEIVDYKTIAPMWLQVIHGNNAKNRMGSGMPAKNYEYILRNSFCIE